MTKTISLFEMATAHNLENADTPLANETPDQSLFQKNRKLYNSDSVANPATEISRRYAVFYAAEMYDNTSANKQNWVVRYFAPLLTFLLRA
jgi:hypothetical protein